MQHRLARIEADRGTEEVARATATEERAKQADVDGAFGEIAQRHFDLRPGDSEVLRLSPDFDSAPRYEVVVRWTDLAGDHQQVRVINHLR